MAKSLSLAFCILDRIKNINMKLCNLVKLTGQYCRKQFQLCRGFQYEVTEPSKWPELFHVKGSQAVHAPPLESNLAGALSGPEILFYRFSIQNNRIFSIYNGVCILSFARKISILFYYLASTYLRTLF